MEAADAVGRRVVAVLRRTRLAATGFTMCAAAKLDVGWAASEPGLLGWHAGR